ncbi:MAG: DNA-binding response regulator [Chlorobiaceae bacterium]|nr:DNA-binding response regulator [Chlorobiaceae bacterium]MBA4310015.1 DNA-binding response regulator [Chlorobiaceae bacterium]
MKILLIEDEKKVSAFIKKGLEGEYYTVDTAFNGKDGLEIALKFNFDLIILDVMLPFLDGITVTKEIRKAKVTTPILLLTVKNSVKDKVEGLDAGADDYLTKPFAFEELIARVRALFRRKENIPSPTLSIADLIVDQQQHKVKRGEKEIILTPKEYAILEYLLINKNNVVSRTKLVEHVYAYNFDTGTNVIDVYINKLRNKIDFESDSPLIHTIRGVGYTIKELEN